MISDWAKNFCITCALLVAGAGQAAKSHWKVFSFREPSFLEYNGNSFVPVRGVEVGAGYTLTAGGEGGFSLDDDTNPNGAGRISLIGPGLLRVMPGDGKASLLLSFEYGDLYLNVPFGQPVILRVGEYLLQIEDAELYIEESVDRKTFKLRNVGPEIEIEKGLVIGRGESYFWNRDSDQPVRLRRPNVASDIEWLRNRHDNNRHRYDLSRKGTPAPTKPDLYNFYLDALANVGFIKLGPNKAGNTFVQNMPQVGPTLRFYIARPIGEAENLTRSDFLYRPSVRAGLALHMLANTIQPARGFRDRTLFPNIAFTGGFSWYGFSLEGEFGFQFPLSLGDDHYFKERRPFAVGGMASYRIDLESIAQSEIGLVVGMRYSYYPMKVSPTADASAAAVSPQSFNLVSWAGIFGVSFLF